MLLKIIKYVRMVITLIMWDITFFDTSGLYIFKLIIFHKKMTIFFYVYDTQFELSISQEKSQCFLE